MRSATDLEPELDRSRENRLREQRNITAEHHRGRTTAEHHRDRTEAGRFVGSFTGGAPTGIARSCRILACVAPARDAL